jgi:CDP-L-myo-inositol myo-inositolphosphotransferase
METPRQHCILFAPAEHAPASAPPLFGLHVVERTVLAFLRAGVREFLVVGDPEGARWIAETLASRRFREARVRVLEPESSLLPVLEREEPCFVARADHLYDRRLVARFVAETGDASATVVAADFRADALRSQEGAARIASWGAPSGEAGAEGMRMAGQGLLAPAGVFAGLARVGASFARAFEDAPVVCRSLENALSLLARREPVATWAVAELWQAVRGDPDARAADLVLARRKVLGGAVGVDDGVVARYLNRPISRRISERLLSRDVKPWQISLASFLTTLGAGTAFAVGHPATGGMIAQFSAVLDGVDGEIARIRYQDSPFGGVYDALLDRIADAALIGGMTFYAWLMGAGHSAVALGFGAVAGSSLSMLVKEKYGTQFRQPWISEREGRWRWLLLGRDGRLFLSLVAGLTGYVEAVLAYLAVGTHVHAGVRMYRIRSEATQRSR